MTSAVDPGKEIWQGTRGIDCSRANVVVAVETINKSVMHMGSPVQLVRAELAFETHSDHLSLHAYKLREGKTAGGCQSIGASAPDRNCFELYKCQLRVDRVVLFEDSNRDGLFSAGDSIQQDVTLNRGNLAAKKKIQTNETYYQQFTQDALQTEYYMTTVPTVMDGMSLQPDSLEVKYTVNVSPKCNNCMLMFELGFSSKATTNLKTNKSKALIDGLTFGEHNENYFAWATTMVASSGASTQVVNVSSISDPGVPKADSGKGKGGTTSNEIIFEKQMRFYANVPADATSISWDPVLGTTEFGAQLSSDGTNGFGAQISGADPVSATTGSASTSSAARGASATGATTVSASASAAVRGAGCEFGQALLFVLFLCMPLVARAHR